jgi:hypothetical protein
VENLMQLFTYFLYRPCSGDRLVAVNKNLPHVKWGNGCRHFVTPLPGFTISAACSGNYFRGTLSAVLRDLADIGQILAAWDIQGDITILPVPSPKGLAVIEAVFDFFDPRQWREIKMEWVRQCFIARHPWVAEGKGKLLINFSNDLEGRLVGSLVPAQSLHGIPVTSLWTGPHLEGPGGSRIQAAVFEKLQPGPTGGDEFSLQWTVWGYDGNVAAQQELEITSPWSGEAVYGKEDFVV